jgi:hypothetical protein
MGRPEGVGNGGGGVELGMRKYHNSQRPKACIVNNDAPHRSGVG